MDAKHPKSGLSRLAGLLLSLALCNGQAALAVNGAQAGGEVLSSAQEYELKAVFLYNLLNFVTWPEASLSQDDPFLICLSGEDPFGESLQLIVAQQKAAGRSLALRRLGNIREAAGCHLIFFSRSELDNLPLLLGQLPPAGLLTVSDIPRFAEHGGMIEFYVKNNRVRLRIDNGKLNNNGLKASAQLLRLAELVSPQE